MFHNYVYCATQVPVDRWSWQAIHVTDSHTYRWQVSEKLPVSGSCLNRNGFPWNSSGKAGNLELGNTFVNGKVLLTKSLSNGWKVILVAGKSSSLDCTCPYRNGFQINGFHVIDWKELGVCRNLTPSLTSESSSNSWKVTLVQSKATSVQFLRSCLSRNWF